MPEKPVRHALDHRPGGFDPTPTGIWHNIGDPGEPAFENGWGNVGGSSVPMRYRLAVGPLNVLDKDGNLLRYTEHQIEIQGDVNGGADGTVVFTLPLYFRHDYDVPFAAHDDAGVYVPCRLYADGTFVRGTP